MMSWGSEAGQLRWQDAWDGQDELGIRGGGGGVGVVDELGDQRKHGLAG